MTSYAPLLSKDGYSNWQPDMIYFDNNNVRASESYKWLTPYMTVSRAAFYRSLPRSMGDRAPNGWQPNPGPQPGGDWYSQN